MSSKIMMTHKTKNDFEDSTFPRVLMISMYIKINGIHITANSMSFAILKANRGIAGYNAKKPIENRTTVFGMPTNSK